MIPTGLDWAGEFPALAHLPPMLAREVELQLQPVNAPAGTVLFDAGVACQALPLIRSGVIRVSKRAENGREIRLYGVHPGELCIVTVSCLLGGDAYPATGVAETGISALALPRPLFMRLTAEHAPFRETVFGMFSDRLTGLMTLVEEVAFHKLDQRLAAWLVQRGPLILVSHQLIAQELGSVREIVSRLLKQFEDQKLVRLGRERIEVLDPATLKKLGE
jgi:CRP/FNR family transcriptional regulator, anaerobic regulatory protein